jgi:hypothetical protein
MSAGVRLSSCFSSFPINWCHQRVVTMREYQAMLSELGKFPINRCHQRVVIYTRFAPFDRLSPTRKGSASPSLLPQDSPSTESILLAA